MESYLQKVKRAKRGDADAFAELYAEVYESMYRFALYTLRNTCDAEDAVSEAVMDAFASVGKLRTEEAFKGWIFRILANKCKDKLREYSRKNEELREELPQEEPETDVAERMLIRSCFFELSDEERLIISMHQFAGYTSREIAEILHRNENTVRSKESRGLKKLADKLEASRCGRATERRRMEAESGE